MRRVRVADQSATGPGDLHGDELDPGPVISTLDSRVWDTRESDRDQAR